MLIDRPQVTETSQIINLVVPVGTANPTAPDVGELFFRSDASALNLAGVTVSGALRVYTGNGPDAGWAEVGAVAAASHEARIDIHINPAQNVFLDGLNLPTLTSGEANFLIGVTSPIQTQLNSLVSNTNAHAANDARHLLPAQNTLLDGLAATLTFTELNYVDGVTSPIQPQLDAIVAVNNTQNSELIRIESKVDANEAAGDDALATHEARVDIHLVPAQNTFLDGLNLPTLTAAEANRLVGVTSPIQAQLNTLTTEKLARNGSQTMLGDLNMAGHRVTALGEPVGAADAVTRNYVDNLVQGIFWKAATKVATTVNIALTGLQTIDGVAVALNDRVLVKNQTDQTQNGIWLASTTAWTRAPDANNAASDGVTPLAELDGAATFVREGDTWADSAWTQVNAVPNFPVDTPVVWIQFSAAGGAVAGNGITVSGATISVTPGDGLTFSGIPPGLLSGIPLALNVTNNFSLGAQLDLSNTTVAPGVYGNASNVPQITVDAKGRVTAVTNISSSGTYQAANALLTAISALAVNGIIVRTSASSAVARAIAVAGNGLTISNGDAVAGNPTVTSNAVTANTANTIVFRDGTGSFSAGTITANLAGTASNAPWTGITGLPDRNTYASTTSATVVIGQLGWRNYGAGHTIFDASGGLSPDGLTINNTNSTNAWAATFPTLMGWNGASTYGVRVDSARVADSSNALGGVGESAFFRGRGTIAVADADTARATGSYMVERGGFSDHLLDFSGSGGSTPRVQLAFSYGDEMWIRAARDADTVFDGIAYPGHNVLHSGNYNNYAPTKAGGGASGTWPIAISGNAASVGGYAVNGGAVANTVVIRDGNNHVYLSYINSSTGNDENPPISQVLVTNGTDSFYRKAGIQHLINSIAGMSISGNAASVTSSPNRTDPTAYPVVWNTTGGTSQNYTCSGVTITSSTGTLNATAVSAGQVTGNEVYSNGWFRSAGSNGWYSTAYAGGVHMTDTTFVRAYNGKGFYGEYYGGAVAGSSYGGLRIASTGNSYNGIFMDNSGGTVGSMTDPSGNGGDWDPTTSWHYYWARGNSCLALGGSTTAAGYRAYTNGSHYVAGNLDMSGNIYAAGTAVLNGGIVINNGSPTLALQDVDALPAFIHNNSNLLYVLRGGSANAPGWDNGPNGRHPMTMDLASGNVSFSGDVTAFSDIRLKKNVQVIENALDKVSTLTGVTFDHIEQGRGTGLIAQDVEKVLPEAVHTAPGDEKYLTVAYGNMVGLLVEAIKELRAEVEQLKAAAAQRS